MLLASQVGLFEGGIAVVWRLRRRVTRLVQGWLIENHGMAKHFIRNKYVAYPFAGGRIFLNARESSMMLARVFGLYEPEKMKAVRTLLKPGGIFIDIGGNKGDFALLAASKVGDSGKVLCIEPEPRNCYWIQESIKLNGCGNIKLFDLALSDHEGKASLYLGQMSGFHTLLGAIHGRNAGVITVRTETLDGLLAELHQGRVDMIKIDVEGAELSVLKGAQQTLSQNRKLTLLIDLHPSLGVDVAQVRDFLSGLGFSMYYMKAPFDVSIQAGDCPSELMAYRSRPDEV